MMRSFRFVMGLMTALRLPVCTGDGSGEWTVCLMAPIVPLGKHRRGEEDRRGCAGGAQRSQLSTNPEQTGSYLRTGKMYRFCAGAEYAINERGNSGVMFRSAAENPPSPAMNCRLRTASEGAESEIHGHIRSDPNRKLCQTGK